MYSSTISLRHVKAKTAWKSVEIPQSVIDDESSFFHGLCGDVQELTDYEIVSESEKLDSDDLPPQRNRKRKMDSDESVVDNISKKKRKKSKKLLKSPNDESNPETNVSDLTSISSVNVLSSSSKDTGIENVSKKKRKKKKKQKKKGCQQDPEPGKSNVDGDKSGLSTASHTSSDLDMSQWKNLFVPEELMHSLQQQGFVNPTEIQMQALPSAIRDRKDIIGAAETGSGKTLAFGIPIITQILSMQRREEEEKEMVVESDDEDSDEHRNSSPGVKPSNKPGPKALILEPTRELAIQVHKHLTRLASHTQLKFATIVGGMSIDKQYRMLKQAPEVVIATPGRLWQLIEEGEQHLSQVDCVHGLVVDEADRMIEKGHFEELTKILHFINESQRRVKRRQTYVMSATLSMEIPVAKSFNKKFKKKPAVDNKMIKSEGKFLLDFDRPKEPELILFSVALSGTGDTRSSPGQDASLSQVLLPSPCRYSFTPESSEAVGVNILAQGKHKMESLTEICIGTKPKIIDLTTKDVVAHTLTEWRINCATTEKDFYLYYFLCEHPGRTLVFVNSKDCLRRLISLFTILERSPLPLHADMHQTQRLKNLDRFTDNSKALLVASDVAARGLDIPKIDHVIHYQVPRTIENYVHRSGRTARASSVGLSVMLVGAEDARDYQKIVQHVKNGKDVPIMPIDMDLMPAVKARVELARSIDEKQHRSKKKKSHNNFFQKAAQEMDIIIDDDKLLADLGSAVEQSEEKQDLKAMKSQLLAMLKKQLSPLHMTKYPTKSGSVVSKKIINLYNTE